MELGKGVGNKGDVRDIQVGEAANVVDVRVVGRRETFMKSFQESGKVRRTKEAGNAYSKMTGDFLERIAVRTYHGEELCVREVKVMEPRELQVEHRLGCKVTVRTRG